MRICHYYRHANDTWKRYGEAVINVISSVYLHVGNINGVAKFSGIAILCDDGASLHALAR